MGGTATLLEEVAKHNIEYHSIGRESILRSVVSI